MLADILVYNTEDIRQLQRISTKPDIAQSPQWTERNGIRLSLAPFHTGNKFQNSISQCRTCSILRNFAEKISLMERCDWSIGQCLQTLIWSVVYGFRKFISSVKALTFKRSIWKMLGPFATASRRYGPMEWAQKVSKFLYFEREFRNRFLWCERGLR